MILWFRNWGRALRVTYLYSVLGQLVSLIQVVAGLEDGAWPYSWVGRLTAGLLARAPFSTGPISPNRQPGLCYQETQDSKVMKAAPATSRKN